MDEINEKAIKDIIAYYDRLEEEEQPEDGKKAENAVSASETEEAPSLVELIEGAQKRAAEREEAVSVAEPEEAAETNEIEPENSKEADETEDEQLVETEEAESDQSVKIKEAEPEKPEETEEIKTERIEPEQFEETEEVEPEQSKEKAETERPEKEEKPKEEPDSGKDGENKEDKKNIPLTITPVYDLSELEDEEPEYHLSRRNIITAAVITLLAAALVVTFVTVDTGFIGRYKQNAARNVTTLFSKFGIDISRDETNGNGVKSSDKYKKTTQKTVTVPMETAGKSVFAEYRGSLVCAYTNYLSLIGSDGTIVWENTTTIVDPILRTAGNYILIGEKGGKKLCLYNDSRLIYEADTEDNILTCNLSSNGDVVAVTNKASYKGAVVVFNREGNRIFAWSSGSDDIISADISSASRRLAVALLNTDDQVKSTIQLFDMNEEESKVQAVFEDTILFDVDFTGDTINAFGDNCMAGLTANGKLVYDKRFDNADFVHYNIDEAGNKILLFDDMNIPLINIYAPNAALKYQLTSDELPEFVDIFGKYIIYNSGRDIIYGKAGKRQSSKYIASMDIKNLIMLDEDVFVIVYSNNLEFVGK